MASARVTVKVHECVLSEMTDDEIEELLREKAQSIALSLMKYDITKAKGLPSVEWSSEDDSSALVGTLKLPTSWSPVGDSRVLLKVTKVVPVQRVENDKPTDT